jgi:hypothetical protein
MDHCRQRSGESSARRMSAVAGDADRTVGCFGYIDRSSANLLAPSLSRRRSSAPRHLPCLSDAISSLVRHYEYGRMSLFILPCLPTGLSTTPIRRCHSTACTIALAPTGRDSEAQSGVLRRQRVILATCGHSNILLTGLECPLLMGKAPSRRPATDSTPRKLSGRGW